MVDTTMSPDTWSTGDIWEMRSAPAVDGPGRRLDRLAPLLHDMVAWGLVTQAQDGTFTLAGDVQDRLAHLAMQRPARTAQVHVGRTCQGCGLVTVTWLVEGTHRCATCRDATATEEEVPAAGEPGACDPRSGVLSRWTRTGRRSVELIPPRAEACTVRVEVGDRIVVDGHRGRGLRRCEEPEVRHDNGRFS